MIEKLPPVLKNWKTGKYLFINSVALGILTIVCGVCPYSIEFAQFGQFL